MHTACMSRYCDMVIFCETQWRHSVKTRLYNTPSPILHCISQLGENKGGQGHWVSQNRWCCCEWAKSSYKHQASITCATLASLLLPTSWPVSTENDTHWPDLRSEFLEVGASKCQLWFGLFNNLTTGYQLLYFFRSQCELDQDLVMMNLYIKFSVHSSNEQQVIALKLVHRR